MPNEAGDMKLLGNVRKLIDYVSADSTYNPSNVALAKTALEAQHVAALAAVQAVATKMAPNKIAISNRQTAFDGLDSLVKRSRNLLKATGASSAILDDAQPRGLQVGFVWIGHSPRRPAILARRQELSAAIIFMRQWCRRR